MKTVFYRLARLWPLLLLPLAGGCGYRAPMHKTVITEDPARFGNVREGYRELTALMTTDTGLPPTDSNTIAIITEHKDKWLVLKNDLESAEESVYIDHYRFRQDSSGTIVRGILREKRARGADVRIILDKSAHLKEDVDSLSLYAADSIDVRLFYRPSFFLDYVWPPKGAHRDHRKIIIVDGKTAYVGGRNIQDKYYLSWRDADLRINGPAVYDLAKVYMENQHRAAPELPELKVTPETARKAVKDTLAGHRQFRGKTVQIVQDSPWDKRLPIRNCFEWAINHANSYFYFYNPYTPPPQSTLKALRNAARRGVDVRWIVPANNDVTPAKWMGESLYRELLKAGVKIYEWQGNVLHTKEFISDDYLVAVGSANMDNMSFFLNLEVDALVYDEEFAVSSRELYISETKDKCLEITLDEVRRWNIFRRMRNWLARVAVGNIT
ncbi:MAG: hypothetical protein J5737_00090 [Bacteroidales bacterium]|nr:hypothetical protein [Bacteroidales bacterium]